MLGYFVERIFRVANKLRRPLGNPGKVQTETLVGLLDEAKDTEFGRYYNFRNILHSKDIQNAFRERVPVFDYDKIYNEWWCRLIEGKGDVCWPGRIKRFALSSGTSGAPSKYIPISHQMKRSMRRAGLRMFMTLPQHGIPHQMFSKAMLMIGGTTSLKDQLDYKVGDLSGINGDSPPFWIRGYYKPGTEISKTKDWNERTRTIVENAPKWDVGYVTGIPSWVQMTLQAVVNHYKLNNIHELWPNLRVFVSGGISYKPYEKSLRKLFGREVLLLDSYLASEGFIAYQARSETTAMQLVLDGGIFMEFVPFDESNFDGEGNIYPHAKTLLIDEVEKEVDYALLISTNAGAWRYLIGDMVRFTNLERKEILITGRTKHFLSVCGEHLSVENMTDGILGLQNRLQLRISEFTVSAVEYDHSFRHQWYIGIDDAVDEEEVASILDQKLMEINDDYATERNANVLMSAGVVAVPTQWFYDFMEKQGKLTGQTKFSRVLRDKQWDEWVRFVADRQNSSIQRV